MIAKRWPEHGPAQHRRILVEHGRLVLGVGSTVVCIVAEHQPQIGLVGTGVRVVGITHLMRADGCGPGISEHPDPCAFRDANGRRCQERVAAVVAREDFTRGADGVVVTSVSGEPVEDDFVFGRKRLVNLLPNQAIRFTEAKAVADTTVGGHVGAPAHDDPILRAHLEIGTTIHRSRFRSGRQDERGDEQDRA